jgi:tRNA dimethylallyltransferase
MITILGPTASGKTAFAVQLAYEIDGEVISADSRQVYRGMSIGTGKDLTEYNVNGRAIPYHLIDIVDPGYEYNIFEYQQDFIQAYRDITFRKKIPILCGGSGLYLESVLKHYRLKKTNDSKECYEALAQKTDSELKDLLISLRTPHNTTDLLDRNRIIRAIMISQVSEVKTDEIGFPEQIPSTIFGIQWDRNLLRQRITERLRTRLENGMIEEITDLLNSGITSEQIKFYGLEYRYIMLFLENKLDYNELFRQLNIAIHQFAKRQMTWFRKMERSGLVINWIDGAISTDDKINLVKLQIK